MGIKDERIRTETRPVSDAAAERLHWIDRKYAWSNFDRSVDGWVPDLKQAVEKFANAYISEGDFPTDVVRWQSNDSIPPKDILWTWFQMYLIDEETFEGSLATSDDETAAFLADYREARKGYRPSAEEMFEMRAAFGEGETVVDVVTGQEFKL
jgi:hypothetical protein